MKAREIMTKPVITVHTGTPVKDAAALLARHGITSLPVLDDDDRVVGIVSEADLIRDRMPHDPRSHLRRDGADDDQPDPAHQVGQVMTDTVVCMTPDADTGDLAELMLSYDVRAIPIVDGDHLEGVVSRRDLLRTLIRDDATVAAEIRLRLDSYAGAPDRWSVAVDDGVATISGHFDDTARRVVSVLARTVPGVSTVHIRRHGPVG